MTQLVGKALLITGGTGSFGRAVVSRLLESGARKIRVFSRDELKQEQMRSEFNDRRLSFHIGDVRDPESVREVMYDVDLVFHAAALKQVPSCEFFPMQAVLTNIHGSYNVIRAAVNHGVASVVCLSTDKAVYPINAMGMSKALMEKVAQAYARNRRSRSTVVSCVRYGNVMFSRGSVIPLFIRQIREGRPITVTVPEMTRFLLPLSDSVDLVLLALSRSERGDVFVKKAPASTIADLAAALRNLFRSPVPIKTIGVRHGEKLYETLITSEEFRFVEDLGDHYRIRVDQRDLNYEKYFVNGDQKADLPAEGYTSHNTRRLSVPEVEQLLLTLPELQAELKQSA